MLAESTVLLHLSPSEKECYDRLRLQTCNLVKELSTTCKPQRLIGLHPSILRNPLMRFVLLAHQDNIARIVIRDLGLNLQQLKM